MRCCANWMRTASTARSWSPRGCLGQDEANQYALDAARAHPDRLWCALEVDAFWRPEFGTDGAAERMDALGEADAIALFPDPARPGWLTTGPGAALVARANERGLPLSIAAPPPLHADVRAIAERSPRVTLMLHHLGMVGEGGSGSLLALADLPNVTGEVVGGALRTRAGAAHPGSARGVRRAASPVGLGLACRRPAWCGLRIARGGTGCARGQPRAHPQRRSCRSRLNASGTRRIGSGSKNSPMSASHSARAGLAEMSARDASKSSAST